MPSLESATDIECGYLSSLQTLEFGPEVTLTSLLFGWARWRSLEVSRWEMCVSGC